MKDIKITVVIPCYNSESTIVRAVNSVLSGNTLPFEILIYDDCSEDNTVKIIEENFKSNSSIILTKGTENKGAGYARDILLKKAKGDFIAFLDADDWWYPQKLDLQMEKIKAENYDISQLMLKEYLDQHNILKEKKSIYKDSNENYNSFNFKNNRIKIENSSQKIFYNSILKADLVFSIGAAGSGKTFLAIGAALHC